MHHSSRGGGGSPAPPHEAAATTRGQDQTGMAAEEASPISSRPPAMLRLGEEDAFGGGGSSSGGNRWPREETLALLQIRSEMDAAFRDATLKAPLWEDVSRKLAELGYKRSAKKCKEKFENVQKYYKRTKQGRSGRPEGKSYKYFSQLEALYATTSAGTPPQPLPPQPLDVSPVSMGITPNMPGLSSVGVYTTTPPGFSGTIGLTDPTAAGMTPNVGGVISFPDDESTEDDEEEEEGNQEPSSIGVGGSGRKRKREHEGSRGENQHMMEFFEGLMRQVMQKQEAMQQRLLEVIEKREQDRLAKEEAWKRQEMARLSQEHELFSQERASSASRDAAIISLLQKITGQTIQLPAITATTCVFPPPQLQTHVPVPVPVPTLPPQPTSQPAAPALIQQMSPPPQQHQPAQQQGQVHHHSRRSSMSSEVITTTPEKVGPSRSNEPSFSSRWPKEEIIALINVRSGLETRYQEPGTKGPLWEEVSARMNQIGYKRSAKRCKEKWENINKYYRKVKESNKTRPEDSKTCPYYHQLDELYRKKIISTGASSGGNGSEIQQQQQEARASVSLLPDTSLMGQETRDVPVIQHLVQVTESTQDTSGVGNEESTQKPEDIVIELMKNQGTQQERHVRQSMVDDFQSDKMNHHDEEEEEEEDDDDDSEIDDEDDGAGSAFLPPSSFLTMVQ